MLSDNPKINNYTLDNHTVYYGLFFTQLAAIVAQGSLRSNPLELLMQVIFWGVLLGLSLSFGWQYRNKQYRNKPNSKLPEQLTNGAALLGMAIFLYQIMNGDLTAGLLLVLSCLLIGLSFSLGKQRSLYFSLAASTVLLLYAASISRSSSFIVYLIIFSLAAVIVLASNFYLTKNKQQVTSQINKQHVTTDFPYKLPITILTVTILLITTALYLFVPRPDAIHWGSFPAGGGQYEAKDDWPKKKEKEGKKGNKNKSKNESEKKSESSEQPEQSEDPQENDPNAFSYEGFADELALNKSSSEDSNQGTGGKAAKDNYNRLLFYMEGKDPQYLRGKVFDYFDGLSWKTTHQTQSRLDQESAKFSITPEVKAPYDQYTITVVANIASNSVYLPAATADLKFPGNAIAINNYGAVTAPRPLRKNTFYSFNVERDGFKIRGRPVDPIQTMSAPDAKELSRYTQLPDDIGDQFIILSKSITKNSSNRLEKAGKVEEFLRSNYKYSLESVFSSQGKIPLEEFLFDTKLGHCEYFATAMVTLMRAQDIPARLVTGFSVSEYNPVTGYYEARSLNAHAWAEVWVESIGWVTYEATPAYPLPKPSETQNVSESIEDYLEERSNHSELIDPNSLTTALLNTAKYAFEQFNLILNKAWNSTKAGLSWAGYMLLIYGWILLLLVVVLYTAYHYLRYFIIHYLAKRTLKKAEKKTAKEQIKTSYAAIQKIFILHKCPSSENWTVQEYQQEIKKKYPELSEEVNSISKSLNLSLYNGKPIPNKVGISVLEKAQIIINHEFEIPRPAEKQVKKIRGFFQKTFSRIFRKEENQYS